MTDQRRIRSVAAIVFDPAGRLLLVRRGHEPSRGLWATPGGKVEPGESDEEALRREMLEETGLEVTVGDLVGSVQRPGGPGVIYEIYEYDVFLVDPTARGQANDDAAELAWVDRAAFAALPLTPMLAEVLAEWDRLPR